VVDALGWLVDDDELLSKAGSKATAKGNRVGVIDWETTVGVAEDSP
jgi:hypothetical protein